MTLFSRLSLFLCICLLSACASSSVQAPVVGGSINLPPENQPSNNNSNNPVKPETYIESSPLPSVDPLQREAIEKNKATVSPVLRGLLAKSETAKAQQNWTQSEVYLERALRIEPKNALVWHRMAIVKMKQNKHNQAIQFASKSNTLARGDEGLKRRNWSVIADANTALNRPEQANSARNKSQGF